ncbi:MAG TPA: cyanophycin synthetase [Solirubrobacteraceae bacterium]|nr:cyanophycin synthetase [Solirubrobacteraceae bacterium]
MDQSHEHARRSVASGARAPLWTPERAEHHLRSLELFGMRFGLDRMRRMMTALGSPQQGFAAIQVLGTNGKSSTTRMIAAILERHGVRTGVYTSPHLVSYNERLRIGERDVSPEAFAQAIARAAHAAEQVDRTLAGDDHVTQFELLTAAALSEMAEQRIELAVVEAGLGGRYDATSVIDAPLTVLTNVALEHTRWLGPTISDIAGEKLAVVRPGGTLVLGAGLAPEARAVADHVAAERRARVIVAPATGEPPVDARGGASGASTGRASDARGGASWTATDRPSTAAASSAPATVDSTARARLRAAGEFQQANFALARTAAQTWLEATQIELDEWAVRSAARETEVPGRLQVLARDPLIVLDGAHNPDAVAALVPSLPGVIGERRLGLVMGVLEDKDAAGMLATLLARCDRAWFTAPRSPRALSPAALHSLARQLGFDAASCEPEPARALAQASDWARTGAPDARAVLVTGSIYLVGALIGGPQGSRR